MSGRGPDPKDLRASLVDSGWSIAPPPAEALEIRAAASDDLETDDPSTRRLPNYDEVSQSPVTQIDTDIQARLKAMQRASIGDSNRPALPNLPPPPPSRASRPPPPSLPPPPPPSLPPEPPSEAPLPSFRTPSGPDTDPRVPINSSRPPLPPWRLGAGRADRGHGSRPGLAAERSARAARAADADVVAASRALAVERAQTTRALRRWRGAAVEPADADGRAVGARFGVRRSGDRRSG